MTEPEKPAEEQDAKLTVWHWLGLIVFLALAVPGVKLLIRAALHD